MKTAPWALWERWAFREIRVFQVPRVFQEQQDYPEFQVLKPSHHVQRFVRLSALAHVAVNVANKLMLLHLEVTGTSALRNTFFLRKGAKFCYSGHHLYSSNYALETKNSPQDERSNYINLSLFGIDSSLTAQRILSIFDLATLKNYISAVIYSSISSYTSLERAKLNFQKKNISASGNP